MSTDLAATLGVRPGDARPWAPATVVSVDVAGARLTVTLDGAAVVLRRVAGPYRPGDVVAVVRDPDGSGAGQFVAGILGPAVPVWQPGVVTAIDAGTARLTVTFGLTSMVLPYVAGTYTVDGEVAVLIDGASGMGSLVLGPLTSPPGAPGVPNAPNAPVAPSTTTVTALVRPTWSGTWRSVRSAWDRWNTGSYGGRSDAYQGAISDSGTLAGLAVYGDQVLALGLASITSAVLTVTRNGSGGSSAAITVQGSASGTPPAGAPASSGDTASSAAIATGQTTTIALPASVCEALRTGAVKGLKLTGATYAGVFGTSRADGMALAITGTKAV